MSAALPHQSPVDLTLHALINTRFEVNRLRSTAQSIGRDFPGNRLARKRGQGIEFLDLRQYTAGDDVRHIDWNVTARTSEPHTRLYQQEKELNTTVIVDLRPVMFNGSTCLRSVSAGLFAAATLWAAHSIGDRCACIVIDGQDVTATRPMPGHKGVLQALELIARCFQASAHTPQTATDDRAPSLSDALDIVIGQKRNTGRHFLFSGFDTDDDQLSKQLPVIGALGRLNAILLIDKMERDALPPGNYHYRFNGRNQRIHLNNATGRVISEYLRQQHNDRLMLWQEAGIDTLKALSDGDVGHYLSALRQRHWM